MVRVHSPNCCGFRGPYAGGVTLTGRERTLQLFERTYEQQHCNSSNTCSQVLRANKFADIHRFRAFTARALPTKELNAVLTCQRRYALSHGETARRRGSPTLEVGVAETRKLIIVGPAHKEIDGLPQRERDRVPETWSEHSHRTDDDDQQRCWNVWPRRYDRNQDRDQNGQECKDDVGSCCPQLKRRVATSPPMVTCLTRVVTTKPASEIRAPVSAPGATPRQSASEQRPESRKSVKCPRSRLDTCITFS